MSLHLNLDADSVSHAHPVKPLCFPPDARTLDVLHELKERNTGQALICRDGILIGIFTERDALRLLGANSNLDCPIEQVMVGPPATLSSHDTVGKAVALMSAGGYRRLPIVDDAGRPIGVVKTSGILHYLVEHFPGTIYNLPPEPHHTTQQREGA